MLQHSFDLVNHDVCDRRVLLVIEIVVDGSEL